RVFLEPVQRRRVKIEYRVLVAFDLLCIGFAMKHAVPTSVTVCSLHLKFACSKRKEVGRNRLRFRITDPSAISAHLVKSLGTVRNRLPAGRHVQLEGKPRLQIRLVETGKRKMRASRHKERVHEVGVPIECGVAGTERNLNGVTVRRNLFFWND